MCIRPELRDKRGLYLRRRGITEICMLFVLAQEKKYDFPT